MDSELLNRSFRAFTLPSTHTRVWILKTCTIIWQRFSSLSHQILTVAPFTHKIIKASLLVFLRYCCRSIWWRCSCCCCCSWRYCRCPCCCWCPIPASICGSQYQTVARNHNCKVWVMLALLVVSEKLGIRFLVKNLKRRIYVLSVYLSTIHTVKKTFRFIHNCEGK